MTKNTMITVDNVKSEFKNTLLNDEQAEAILDLYKSLAKVVVSLAREEAILDSIILKVSMVSLKSTVDQIVELCKYVQKQKSGSKSF